MKALILANGLGTRLRPLTNYTHKTMLPVVGKPVLEHIIEHLVKHNIKDIVMAVGVKKEQIINYFGRGERLGVNIEYAESKDALPNTAGEIAKARDMLEHDEDFLIYYGDTLTNIDLKKFYEFHKLNEGIITLACIHGVPIETSVVSGEQGKAIKFEEKPVLNILTNIPVFYCSRKLFESENIMHGKDFSADVIPEFVETGRVFIYQEDGNYHYDVGTLQRYEKICEIFNGRRAVERVVK